MILEYYMDNFFLVWFVFVVFIYVFEFVKAEHEPLKSNDWNGWANYMLGGAALFHFLIFIVYAVDFYIKDLFY